MGTPGYTGHTFGTRWRARRITNTNFKPNYWTTNYLYLALRIFRVEFPCVLFLPGVFCSFLVCFVTSWCWYVRGIPMERNGTERNGTERNRTEQNGTEHLPAFLKWCGRYMIIVKPRIIFFFNLFICLIVHLFTFVLIYLFIYLSLFIDLFDLFLIYQFMFFNYWFSRRKIINFPSSIIIIIIIIYYYHYHYLLLSLSLFFFPRYFYYSTSISFST